MLTEIGGLLMLPDAPKEKWDWLYGLYGSCGTAEELRDRYRALMACLSEFPFLAGFCYTQLTDIEQEINGLLTYDRKPKLPPEEIALTHMPFFKRPEGE